MPDVEAEEVSYWEGRFAECESTRKTYEEQWYLNLAFYSGKQWAVWQRTGVTNRLVEPAAPRNRVRLISNKCKPIIRRELTKLTKEEPHFYVVPNTTEPADVAAARVGETIADYCLRVGRYNVARRRATFWSLICGTGFIKTTCVKQDGPIIYAPVSPLHIYVPHIQEEDIEAQPFVIHGRALSPEAIFETYGIRTKPNVQVNGAQLEQKFFTALGIQNATADKNLVYVKEVWVKPCLKYKTGALIVIADGAVIYRYEGLPKDDTTPVGDGEGPISQFTTDPQIEIKKSDYPYEHGMFPFQKIDHIPAGRFYADSVLVDIIPLQKEYNKSRSQITESKNRTSKPQITYDKGSLDPTKVTSEAGLMIPINPGFNHPRPMDYPGLQAWVIQDQDRILTDMDDLSSQFQVSKGRTPPGVEAASAIAYLQEENDSALYHTVASIEDATEYVGKQSLGLVQQFWSDEYLTEVVSKNSTQDAQLFKAADVKANTDIRIEAGSMAPKSRAAKQAFITELMKMGIIPPEKGLRYLELNETSRMYEELQVDARQAQRENMKMAMTDLPMEQPPLDPNTGKPAVDPATGQPALATGGMPVNEWDEHRAHIHEHGLFMKSEQYDLLDENKRHIFLIHYQDHRAHYQVGLMAEQQMGQPPQGQEVPAQGAMQ